MKIAKRLFDRLFFDVIDVTRVTNVVTDLITNLGLGSERNIRARNTERM